MFICQASTNIVSVGIQLWPRIPVFLFFFPNVKFMGNIKYGEEKRKKRERRYKKFWDDLV